MHGHIQTGMNDAFHPSQETLGDQMGLMLQQVIHILQ